MSLNEAMSTRSSSLWWTYFSGDVGVVIVSEFHNVIPVKKKWLHRAQDRALKLLFLLSGQRQLSMEAAYVADPNLRMKTRPDYGQGLSCVRKTVIVLDSSLSKSWSENNDSYNGSGLSAEPAGPETEQRETSEEPPAETPQCWGGRGRQRLWGWKQTGLFAATWLYDGERIGFFLYFTALSWFFYLTPI